MANPMPPFMTFLFVSAFSLSFSHTFPNLLTIFLFSLIPFTISSSRNLFAHYHYHSIHLPCCRQRMRVLPTVKEKRLPSMICLLRQWVERLPILRKSKRVAIMIASVLLSLTHDMIPIFISPWCSMNICLLCHAVCGFPFATMIQSFLGFFRFLHSQPRHPPRNCITHAHSFWIRIKYIIRLKRMGGHGVVGCGFYDGTSTSRCVKGYSFLQMLVQLSGLV